MKSVWEVCELDDDVKYGRLDPSRFAVELHSVLDGTANFIYKNPELFLRYTYPTSSMKYLLKEALRRISGKAGQPVFILDTEFGGGKTHSLLLLYHIFKNPKLGTEYIHELGLHKELEVLEVPSCEVVAIDCRKMGKATLWGEIAEALGRYEEFKEEDLSKKPVRDISKLKSLFNKPTLLLIDELPDLLLKASAEKIGDTNLSDLTISFILNLISAVSTTKDSMLIITLTGKQSLYERYVASFRKHLESLKIEEVDEKVREAFSRQAQYLVPVKKEEVSHVVKRRLIKTINDNKELQNIVKSYYDYFSEKGIVNDINYGQRLENCYPFHPFLIDILYDRVSTIEAFNKTRGALRLLALILHRIYRDRVECKLVSPGDIPLEDPEIMDELTSRLGRADFRPVVETDCIEKAKRLDEKRRVKLVEKAARTIYLYSLIGETKISGILPNHVKLAVCSPGIDPSLVDEVLSEMDKEFWYLKSEAGAYYFDKEPNINKIIYDYMGEVKASEIRETIREELKELLPNVEYVKVIVWDKSELRDDEDLKIFVVDYKDVLLRGEGEVLEELLEQREGGGIRTYRNTIVFLIPEREATMEDSARRLCAVEKAKKDERVKIDKERIKRLDERLSEAKSYLTSDCINVYARIAYPRIGDGKIHIDVLPPIEYSKKANLTVHIIEFLKKKGKLVEKLSSDIIADIVKSREKIKLEEIYALFKQDRSKPFILSGRVVADAVSDGIEKKRFGYAATLEEKEGKYLAKIGEPIMPDWRGWLIREDLVHREKEEPKKPEEEGTIVIKPLYQHTLEFSSLKVAVDGLRKVRVISPGREFEAHLRLEISDAKNLTNITIDSRDWQRISEIEGLIEQLSRFGYYGKGTLTISSKAKEMIEDLKKVGVM